MSEGPLSRTLERLSLLENRPRGRRWWSLLGSGTYCSHWALAAVMAALTLGAIITRAGRLGPPSLFYDDAWVAIVYRAHGLNDSLLPGLTSPGFVLLLKGWLAVVGFGEVRAQLLPFLMGIAAPGLLYLVAVRRGLAPAAALLAGVVLLVSPIHATYSTAVKQYALDAIGSILLLWLAWGMVQEPLRARRWLGFAALAAVLTLMSAPLVLVAWGGIAGALVSSILREKRLSPAAVLVVIAFGLFSWAFWAIYLRHVITHPLSAFFRPYYVPVAGGLDVAATHTIRGVVRVLRGLVPIRGIVTSAALVASALYLIRRRLPLAVAFLSPLAMVVVLAMARKMPLGGGRVDIFLYPGLCLALAAGFHGLLSRVPRAGSVLAIVSALVLLTFAPLMGLRDYPVKGYPLNNIKPLVARLERVLRPGDATIVYPIAVYPMALYSSWPVHFRRNVQQWTGFDLSFDHPDVTALNLFRYYPSNYRPTVAAIATRYRRIWLIAEHPSDDFVQLMKYLRWEGFARTAHFKSSGASLMRWEKMR